MAEDSPEKARERLSALTDDSTAHWVPAHHLAQDAALISKLMVIAAGHQHGDGRMPDVTLEEVGAALTLFDDMRNQLEKLETQVVIEARRRGMDWKRIAAHQGLKSSQAASQRYQRLMTRLEEIRQGVR